MATSPFAINSKHVELELRWNALIKPLQHSKEEYPKDGVYSASSFASSVANYSPLKNLPQAIHIQEQLIKSKSWLDGNLGQHLKKEPRFVVCLLCQNTKYVIYMYVFNLSHLQIPSQIEWCVTLYMSEKLASSWPHDLMHKTLLCKFHSSVSKQMAPQIYSLVELFVAFSTLVRLFSTVGSQVSSQIGSSVEWFVAFSTFVQFLPSVN